jgi:hypothetical protein
VTVRPEGSAAPIELDAPQWSSVAVTTSLPLAESPVRFLHAARGLGDADPTPVYVVGRATRLP